MSGLTNPVMSEADLNNDLLIMSTAASGDYTITLGAGFTLGSDIDMVNLLPGVTLTIDGAGNTIDGASLYRGFLVYAGTVTIDNLDLADTAAIGGAGGSGKEGGGGGAGLGGGLFVAAAGIVTLAGVSMTNDAAVGGAGGNGGGQGYGGGGGMGGAGGNGNAGPFAYGTGGGGLGHNASGAYFETVPGTGIAANGAGGGNGYANGGSTVTEYGAGSGGGGGLGISGGGAGGGGIGGAAGSKYAGGNGGFGGGGGGFSYYGAGSDGGGVGGFGGGAGAGNGGTLSNGNPSQGGFGGGGGGDKYGGFGGLGGGSAGAGTTAGGGGGLGGGGDIFLQRGGQLTIESGTLTGGTASGGGAGSGGGGYGIGVAAGIFLYGNFGSNQSITLAPGAGKSLTIADPIADVMGAFGTGEVSTGNLLIGPGTVQLTGANAYSGGTTLEAGATLVLGTALSAGSAGSGAIAFAAPSDLLEVGMGTGATLGLGNTIDGLTVNDGIDVLGFAQNSITPATMLFNGTLDQLTLEATIASVPSHRILQLDTGRGYIAGAFSASIDADGTGTLITYAACFAAGTQIETETGAAPVERLAVGQRVRLATGGTAPVIWLGHRDLDCLRHKRPHEVWPVRINRDAFGPERPARTLWLSPDHAVFVDGCLIPIRYLVNGATIAQVPRERVSYWHVELPAHQVILAEGLPAESYLDTGNRGAFANGGTALHLHADFALRMWATKACAPLAVDGPTVAATRSLLLTRAGTLGYARTADPDLQLFAGGVRLPLADGVAQLPPRTQTVRLVSRTFVPAEHNLAADHRRLGVAVTRLALDGNRVGLDDARLAAGWHATEPGLRWTDGDAAIHTNGARTLTFDYAALGRYWRVVPVDETRPFVMREYDGADVPTPGEQRAAP